MAATRDEQDDEPVEPAEDGKESEPKQSARIRRLLSDLLDSGQALRKGSQDLVTGVAQGTKEELVRLISAEFRGFLDKMDAVDLAQEIVSGLVMEVKAEIRFSRAAPGDALKTSVKSDTKLKTAADDED